MNDGSDFDPSRSAQAMYSVIRYQVSKLKIVNRKLSARRRFLLFTICDSRFTGRNATPKFSGDSVGRVTPVPIPNTEVKPTGADDTASFRCGKVGSRRI